VVIRSTNPITGFIIIILDTIHTGVKVHRVWLGDTQTCGITLALAYILYHLSTA